MPFPGSRPLRGEIYWLDHNPARGSEQAGVRPAVVVSRREFNQGTPVVVVAAITSSPRALAMRRSSPVCVHLPQGQPTPEESLILGFQVMTAAQARLEGYIGTLTAPQLLQLDAALRLSFGL